MKKSNGIIVLILILLISAGLGYIAFFGTNSEGSGSAKNIKQGLDLAGGVSITYQVVGEENPSEEEMSDTVYKLQQRVQSYQNSTEAAVYQEGKDRISIEIPGMYDAQGILEELGRPGSLYFIIQCDDEGNENYSYVPIELPDGTFAYTHILNKDIATLEAEGGIVLYGTDVKEARAGYITSQVTGGKEIVVDLSLTDEGTLKFAEATQKAFMNGWSIGIYYDGQFISVPNVNAVINNGMAQISGNFTFEEAEKLASNIRIGGLSLELEELSSNVVGAQLGSEAIETSVKAGIIGLCVIILLMLVIYRIPGVAASVSLVIYTILTLLLLNFLNITLTLPGIEGIILSIGMAVDANVIIFERIKEEIATGKTVKSAMDIGFKKALSAIVDGNVTTLIAAVVLMIKGSGTVKGFAQTLALGIVLSMFTALVICKLILKCLYAIGLKSEKLYGTKKDRKSINFISKKAILFAISAVAILAGFVFFGINSSTKGSGLNYNLEFSGGTSFNVTFPKEYSLEEVDSTIKPEIEAIIGDGNIQASKVNDSTAVTFKTMTLENEVRNQVFSMFETKFGVTEKVEYQNISATISKEMRSDAIVAVIIAAVLMLLYIWFRFKDIRFGASSVLALMHDVLVVFGFYVISRISVGSTFIACMLTIIGYSINATIVIFDRIRENIQIYGKKADLAEVVNKSVTQTMTRSIYTSLTTFITVLALYIFGVTSIKEFALPLIVGIVCGAYSSVCIAGSLWYVMHSKKEKKAN